MMTSCDIDNNGVGGLFLSGRYFVARGFSNTSTVHLVNNLSLVGSAIDNLYSVV